MRGAATGSLAVAPGVRSEMYVGRTSRDSLSIGAVTPGGQDDLVQRNHRSKRLIKRIGQAPLGKAVSEQGAHGAPGSVRDPLRRDR